MTTTTTTSNTDTETTMTYTGALYLDLDAILTHGPGRGKQDRFAEISIPPEPFVDPWTGQRFLGASWYSPAAIAALNEATELANLEVVLFDNDEHPDAIATAAEIGLRYHRTLSHLEDQADDRGDPRLPLIADDLRTHPHELVAWVVSIPDGGISTLTYLSSGELPRVTQRDHTSSISRAANPMISALVIATNNTDLTRRNLRAIAEFPVHGGRLLADTRLDRTRTQRRSWRRARRWTPA